MPLSLTEARALYDSGASVAHVAAELDLKADAFRKLRLRNNWPLRPSPIVRRAGEAAASKTKVAKTKVANVKPRKTKASKKPLARAAVKDPQPTPLADANIAQANPPEVNLPAFRQQVAEATQRELAKVHKALASGTTEDVERNARLLASLVKSLAELRRLEALDPLGGAKTPAVEGQDDQRPPRDLETLRDELARALERLSGEPGAPRAG